MCTLSFVPKSTGYLLGMNRDEKIARGHGFPPHLRRIGSTDAVFPSEENGGTWIGSNQYGITLALLNWNVPSVRQGARRSRGLIIPQLLTATSLAEINNALTSYEVRDCAPFRLIAVIPSERTLLESSWDGRDIRHKTCPWNMRHWFSSSASDIRAEEIRGRVCFRSSNNENAGSVAWLRQLHRSHEDGPGAFSMCVHRDQVETLSYTEVCCTREELTMLHAIGSPCHPREIHVLKIRRLYRPELTATSSAKKRIERIDARQA
jgi:hypothetical protein